MKAVGRRKVTPGSHDPTSQIQPNTEDQAVSQWLPPPNEPNEPTANQFQGHSAG